jgi:hypothetical protein
MTWPFTFLALHRQEMPTDAENRDLGHTCWGIHEAKPPFQGFTRLLDPREGTVA